MYMFVKFAGIHLFITLYNFFPSSVVNSFIGYVIVNRFQIKTFRKNQSTRMDSRLSKRSRLTIQSCQYRQTYGLSYPAAFKSVLYEIYLQNI